MNEITDYKTPATRAEVEKAMIALKKNGIEAEYVESGIEAKERVLALLPEGAQVFTMTSQTLEQIGLVVAINEPGRYTSVRKKFAELMIKGQRDAMRRLEAAPDWAIGSVHAVTKSGQVVVVSNTGSQLPAYAYGAGHVLWVVGTQKLVANLDEAFRRIYDYVLPLESERAKKAYGAAGSNVSKILIVHKEINPGRLKILFVGEALGF